MSVGAALALVGFTMLALPTVSGVNLVYGSAVAALLAVPQMIVYTMMSRRVSRTGGDYVWLSRSLGGFVGSTITFMGITVETMPYLALIALSAVFRDWHRWTFARIPRHAWTGVTWKHSRS